MSERGIPTGSQHDPLPTQAAVTSSGSTTYDEAAGTESVGTLVREVATDVSQLMRQELELAKAEMKQEAKTAGKGAGLLGGAGIAGWLALLFVSLTVMWALSEAMHLAWAALIVAAVWGIAAAVLYVQGRQQMARVDPVPEQTVQSVKEDVKEAKEWASRRNS